MKEKFTNLIANRNKNIQNFLLREMTAEGYSVYTAKNGCEVLKIINFEHPDILILDLDMPYLDGLEILEQLQNENRSIPVVLHSFNEENENYTDIQKITAFVEKNGNSINGNSINNLRTLIADALRKYYSRRFIQQDIQHDKY